MSITVEIILNTTVAGRSQCMCRRSRPDMPLKIWFTAAFGETRVFAYSSSYSVSHADLRVSCSATGSAIS